MNKMKFLSLHLLSQNEKKAFRISFTEKPTVIQAPNGYGKSALLKSFYDTFGAIPHKIDNRWKNSRVYSMLEFAINEEIYHIIKAGDTYALFDKNGERLLRTTEVTKELSPFLAELFDFKLTLRDQRDKSVLPPPAYIFAPYYIDQDKSWSNSWAPFTQMYLPNSSKVLSDYHSGSRSNSYYEAQNERDKFKLELKEIESRRQITSTALKFIEQINSDVSINYDIENFQSEIVDIVESSRILSRKQIAIREKIGKNANEREIWIEQRELLRGAISESKNVLASAVQRPEEVQCPTCGQSYENSIAEQFGLVEDYDGFAAALIDAEEKIRKLDKSISENSVSIDSLSSEILQIESILDVKREVNSFRDVVVSEGKTETRKLVQIDIDKDDNKIEETSKNILDADSRMNKTIDKEKSRTIKTFFSDRLKEFSQLLDVRFDEDSFRLDAPAGGRGSEGPRGMISYYYAFLHTAKEYSSSTFCPIVVDAPNQQGQDKVHLKAVVEFVINQRPIGSQLILGIEDIFDVSGMGVDLIVLEGPKDQLLRSDMYDAVLEKMRPYIAALL